MTETLWQRSACLFVVLCSLSSPLQAASLAGLWIGNTTKDPITDRPTSVAMAFDKADGGSMALRCKNGALDFFISPNDPQFTVGTRQSIALRFDTSEPIILDAIATEPGLLAVVQQRDANALLPFLTAKTIAVRFSGAYGRDYTMQFLSVLPPNALSKIGRVLADCDVAPYPEEEIVKATSEMAKAAEHDGMSRRAKRPHR